MGTVTYINDKLKPVSGPPSEERDFHRICAEIDEIQRVTTLKGLSPRLRAYLDKLPNDKRFSYYSEAGMSHLCMQVEVYAQRFEMGLVPYSSKD